MEDSPHYEWATAAFASANANAEQSFNDAVRADTLIQATLALAYEQRTANLIAMWGNPESKMETVTYGVGETTVGALLQEILERLGVKRS